MLLVAALASAVLIISVSFDAFRGRTALAAWQFSRTQTPAPFWGVLVFYLLGAVAILFLGIASVIPEMPDCSRLPDGSCTFTFTIPEPQA